MDQELAQIATSGAQTIVNLMLTDTWKSARSRIAQIFSSKKTSDDNQLSVALETSRERLLSAESDLRSDVELEEQDRWEARFRLLLIDDPTAVAMIRDLIEIFAGVDTTSTQTKITIRASAHGNSRVYQLGSGTQHNG